MTARGGLNAQQVAAYLDEVWPGVTSAMTIEEVGDRRARVRQRVGENGLRPGGIVSGPVLMSLADSAVWAAIIGELGDAAMAVTVSLNIHFLRPAPPGDVVAEAQLHRVGRRLATGDVLLYADGQPDPVALATVTYALPR
ncbi:MAG TPA: PaaI family thioesterase [Acidimicrobiia bacterium]|nr:PaaI family thioesterase [Acidimicrobiia bacterium]